MRKQHSQCFKTQRIRIYYGYSISIRISFSAGALPKNYGNACSNVPGANRICIKAKSRDNSILNRTISRHRSNTVLDKLIDKIWQHQSINPDKEQIETYKNAKEMPADCRLKSIIKCSNEIATFLGSKDLLCAEASTEAR